MKIRQVEKKEVLTLICDGVTVYRLKANSGECINLNSLTVAYIIMALKKDNYIYFTLEV